MGDPKYEFGYHCIKDNEGNYINKCKWCQHPFETDATGKAIGLAHVYNEEKITIADAKCTEDITQTRLCTWNGGKCTGSDTTTIAKVRTRY